MTSRLRRTSSDPLAAGTPRRRRGLRRTLVQAGGVLGATALMAGFTGIVQVSTSLVASAAFPPATITVTVTTNLDDGSGGCTGTATVQSCTTLREAVNLYNVDGTSQVYAINFATGANGTINLTLGGTLSIDSNAFPGNPLIITGNGTTDTILSGAGISIGDSNPGGPIEIDDLTVTTAPNGALSNTETGAGGVTLTNDLIENSTSSGNGAGIENEDGTLTATNVTVTGNSTTGGNGGGISNQSGATFNGTGLTLQGNSAAAGSGGGIYNDGTFTATGVTVTGNSAINGGGIFNDTSGVLALGTPTLVGGTIATNTALATGAGGGLFNSGSATLDGVTVGGSAGGDANQTTSGAGGGGIYTSGPLSASNGSISNNIANNSNGGGGLYSADPASSVVLTNETINNNAADAPNSIGGGGILTSPAAAGISVTGGTISFNHSNGTSGSGLVGGGVDLGGLTTFQTTFNDVAIDHNSTADGGGGLYTIDPVDITNGSDISINTVTSGPGGGVDLQVASTASPACTASVSPAPPAPISPAVACIDDTTIDGNGATQSGAGTSGGGGVDAGGSGAVLLTNGSVSSNHILGSSAGTSDGGGIWAPAGGLTLVNESVDSNTILKGSDTQEGGGIDSGDNPTNIFESDVSNNVTQPTVADEATGGGLEMTSTAVTTMWNDTVSGNSTGRLGGGIANGDASNNGGTLTLNSSTVSGNTLIDAITDDGGAGVFNGASGTINATNDTITGNTGAYQGGGFYNSSTLDFSNLTISDNTANVTGGTGGGIYNSGGTVSLLGTILAHDTQTNSPPVANECAGAAVISLGYNMELGSSCVLGGTGDQVGDPLLQPLALNAPGTTKTQALSTGSPAIGAEAGSAPCPEYDQRGVLRPSPCDIGAYQTSAPTSFDIVTVTAVTPDFGSVAGGYPVTITGTNFLPLTQFYFGANPVTGSGCSSTSCTVTVPAGTAAGVVDVRANAGYGLSPINHGPPGNNDQFTYLAAPTPLTPTVTSVTLSSGPAGSSVVIGGTNFAPVTLFTFGVNSTTGTGCSTTSCTVVVPAGSGLVNVQANNGFAVSLPNAPFDDFTYTGSLLTPTVTNVNPDFASAGSAVVVTGTNFAATTVFNFGPNPTTGTGCSSTSCTVIVPAGVGIVEVQANNGVAISPLNPPFDEFSYTGAPPPAGPVITSISPNTASGGQTVTITGSGFTTPSTLFNFGPLSSTGTCLTTTTCTVVVPAGTGTVNVQAVTGAGASPVVPADAFTFMGSTPSGGSSGGTSGGTGTSTPPPTTVIPGHGYWLVGKDGGIFAFGVAQFEGSAAGFGLQRPIVGISPTPDRLGYWLVATDGGVFNFGDAANLFYGSLPGEGFSPAGSGGPHPLNAPIVGMVPTNDSHGYFLVGKDGGVFTFGDAKYEGSCPAIGGCYGAVVAVAPDASGNGYWVFTARGTVYAFGDAANYGQPGPQSVPVVSAVRTPDGKGYWILFSNGAIAPYGDAANLGSPLGAIASSNPAAAIFATSDGGGYWVATSNGTVFAYGDAPNDGGTTALNLNGPIIAANGS